MLGYPIVRTLIQLCTAFREWYGQSLWKRNSGRGGS